MIIFLLQFYWIATYTTFFNTLIQTDSLGFKKVTMKSQWLSTANLFYFKCNMADTLITCIYTHDTSEVTLPNYQFVALF